MLIWLTGFMGAGKSSVGSDLSRRLGFELLDMDTEIESRMGRRIPDIFATEGESVFREVETRVLRECARRDDAVIATGGGVVEVAANVDHMLETGSVVFLDCDFEALRARVAGGRDRPLFEDIEAARLRYDCRRPAYERCHLRVATVAGTAAAEAADTIFRWLEAECAI